MINFKKLLILISMMSVSLGSVAAPVNMPWSVLAGPITSTVSAEGDTVSTVSATLFDSSNAILATGSISDFMLSVSSTITGLFTSGAGTYTITGGITDIPVFNAGGVFVFSGFTGNGDIDFGSISITPGSSSLDLSGETLDFTAVVPVPAAVWLFGSALIALVGVRRSKVSA